MRPVFKQPGAAGFVLAMGFTSGFPMGAVLTNKLYEKNLCTKEEAGTEVLDEIRERIKNTSCELDSHVGTD